MKKTLLCLSVVAVLAGCAADDDDDAVPAAEEPVPAESVAPPVLSVAGTVNDPQVASIVGAANDIDIKNGELARGKTTDAQVKAFAEHMIADHTAMNTQAGELVQRLNVTPEESAKAGQVREIADRVHAQLKGLTGKEFDRAYINAEVNFHQNVLNDIDNTLLPSAQNAELKELLRQARAKVEQHLQQAKQIQSAIGTG